MPDCHAWATENVDFYVCYQIVLINYFTVFRYYRDDEEESLSTISFNFRKKLSYPNARSTNLSRGA